MDIPAGPLDTLAQPSRARLFAILGELRRPAGTDELAQTMNLHANGVRTHLDRMAEAGLVRREAVRQPRGRPRDMWSIAPGARPGGDPPSAYADLGRWLTRVLSTRKASPRAIEAAGRAIGQEMVVPGDERPAEEQMFGALASLGFQPARTSGDPSGAMTYRLRNCPYREAAAESQQVVCGLHRGITRGLLDGIEPATKLVEFVPHDPFEAGCLIALRGGLADDVRRPPPPPRPARI